MHGPGSNGKRGHGNFKQENIGGKNFHKNCFLRIVITIIKILNSYLMTIIL